MNRSRNVAVLLDLDNIKPDLEQIEKICARYGRLAERKAFANTPAVLTAYGAAFRKFGYRFEICPGLSPEPDEVDRLIYRAAHDLANRRDNPIEVITVVSNDNDYAELCHELRKRNVCTVAVGIANQIGKQFSAAADHVVEELTPLRTTYVGIDLGTTNTVMAQVSFAPALRRWVAAAISVEVTDERKALVNSSCVPSSVMFRLPSPEIGGHVRAFAPGARNRTILAWKHDMGSARNGLPVTYQLSKPAETRLALPEYMKRYAVSGEVAPEEAAAAVLSFCREKLDVLCPATCGAVITHPASYESDAIEATRQAAVLAGWNEENVVLLPEPHAALFDFLDRLGNGEIGAPLDVSQSTHVLVYDLGGGTLDVSLHEVRWDDSNARFAIDDIAVGSRTRVGGDRMDALIADYILQQVASRPDAPVLTQDEQESFRDEILIYAEKWKKVWGATYAKEKPCPPVIFQGAFLRGKLPIRLVFSSETVRKVLEPLLCTDLGLDLVEKLDPNTAFEEPPFVDRLDTFVVPVLELLLKARQSRGHVPKIDAILLNGGATYFPLVRERLNGLFGGKIPLLTHGAPELAVARGAALFAAGMQGAGSRRVNPTHIYLEVTSNHSVRLELLVAQGQTFPYRTRLPAHRIPDAADGVMSFRIWVGMGGRPNVNTVLQRERHVSMREIHEAGLNGKTLDLEVEYRFDERLVLTLIGHMGERFQVEVARERAVSTVASSAPVERNAQFILTIPRERVPVAEVGHAITASEWTFLARDLAVSPSNADLQRRVRDQLSASAHAVNRVDLAHSLRPWLGDALFQPVKAGVRCYLALRCIRAVLAGIPASDREAQGLDASLQGFVLSQWGQMGRRTLLNRTFAQELALTPGKLLWENWDQHLQAAFKASRTEGFSVGYLDSLGKCGSYRESGTFLRGVISTGSQPQREKACYALARLLSPGQPAKYRVGVEEAYATLPLLLERLLKDESDHRVTISLMGALWQVAAWEVTSKVPLPQAFRKQLLALKITDFAARTALSRHVPTRTACTERLRLLPELLNWEGASHDNRARIQEYLLEVVRDNATL